MEIKSLGYRTDFIFTRFDGEVIDRGEYIVVRTANNPNYFWGNLLLFKKPPCKGDYKKWVAAFKKEFTNQQIYHITLGWDSPEADEGNFSEFVENGYELDKSIVLSTEIVSLPPKFNEKVEVNVIDSDEDFETAIKIQIACGGDHLSKESWEGFYRKQMTQYRLMTKDRKGFWFGAYLNKKLVGSLGIYIDGEVGRYQIVSTDPNHQRLGVCSSLVFHSAQYAFNKMGVKTLVMVADEEYHAAKIYCSVGFKPTQKQIGLCWWDKEKHN